MSRCQTRRRRPPRNKRFVSKWNARHRKLITMKSGNPTEWHRAVDACVMKTAELIREI